MDEKNPLKMKVADLKAELGRRGLSQTGLKFDLAQRLQTAMDVDEFGTLPSLLSTPQPWSSLSSEEPKPSEQVGLIGGPAITSSAVLREGTPPTVAEGSSAFEDPLINEGKESDGTEADVDEPDRSTKGSVLTGQVSLEAGSECDVDNSKDDMSNINEGKNYTEQSSSVVNGISSPLASSDQKEDVSTGKDFETVGGDERPLPICGSPTKTPGAPSSPCEDKNIIAGEEDTHMGLRAEEKSPAPDVKASDELKDHSSPTPMAAEKDSHKTATEAMPQDAPEGEENHDGSSASLETVMSPSSLLSCSQSVRMKDREERFRQEKTLAGGERTEGTVGNSKRGHDSGCSGAGGGGEHSNVSKDHDVDGKCTVGAARGGPALGSGGGVSSKTWTVEDDCRAKLMKRKERFSAAPSKTSGSNNETGNARREEPPSGVVRSEKVVSGKQGASDSTAAKMLRRAERFGGTGGGTCAPSATPASAEVRDPRGGCFPGSNVTPKHGSKQQPPSAETSSLDPLPQRKKRAQAEATTPRRDGDSPEKRRRPGSSVASEPNHGRSARKGASSTSSPRGRRNEGHGVSDEPAGI
ncbi:unnamed protein product, partial [Ectocarpus sp. 12 AP-2014]